MINITKNTKNTIILPLYELGQDIIQTIIKTDTIIEKDTIINGILSEDYEIYFDNNDKKINIKDISLYPERASKFIINEGNNEHPIIERKLDNRITSTTLLDSIKSNNAELITPVSKFNNSMVQSKTNFSAYHMKIEFMMNTDDLDYNQMLIQSSDDDDYMVLWHNGSIVFVYGSDFFDAKRTAKRFSTNKNHYVEIIKNGYNATIKVDGIDQYLLTSFDAKKTGDFTIGSKGDGTDQYNGLLWNIKIIDLDNDNILFNCPLPNLEIAFDNNNNPLKLTNTNTKIDYIKGGSTWMIDKGVVLLKDGTYIPNKPDKTISYPLNEGDIEIPYNDFINKSPFKIDMLGTNTTDNISVYIFDKGNTNIWKSTISTDNYIWLSTEMTQEYIDDHIKDIYKGYINIGKDFITVYNKSNIGNFDDIELKTGQGVYTVSSNGYDIKKGIYCIVDDNDKKGYTALKADKKIYKAYKRKH